jgi:hypothetical protein
MNRISDDYTLASTLFDEAKKFNIPLNFIGFKDDLKHNTPLEDGGYIINIGNNKNGTHWTCFWSEKNTYYYFDSFGFPPPLEVLELIQPYDWNGNIIQDYKRGYCGSYCIEFLQWMHEKKEYTPKLRMMKFIRLFKLVPEKNAFILRGMEGR